MVESLPANDCSSHQKDDPSFEPRKGVLIREYHVVVTWPDGRRLKVGQFPRKPDAVRWIKQKSAEWLAQSYAAGNSDQDATQVRKSVQAGAQVATVPHDLDYPSRR